MDGASRRLDYPASNDVSVCRRGSYGSLSAQSALKQQEITHFLHREGARTTFACAGEARDHAQRRRDLSVRAIWPVEAVTGLDGIGPRR